MKPGDPIDTYVFEKEALNQENTLIGELPRFETEITKPIDLKDQTLVLYDRLQTALTSSRAGMWDWDIPTNTIYWDDQMLEIYGICREDLLKGGLEIWIKTIHPEDKERSVLNAKAAMNGHEKFDEEYRILRSDGQERYVRAFARAKKDQNGKSLGMIGVCYDVTEEKDTQTALDLALKYVFDVQKCNQTVSKIMGPLEGIDACADAIKTEALLGQLDLGEALKNLNKISKAVMKITYLINEINHQSIQVLSSVGEITKKNHFNIEKFPEDTYRQYITSKSK